MTIEITVNIPALDHFAQVLEGRDLAVLVDNFRSELNERLDQLAQHRVEAATTAVVPSKPEPEPAPAPAPGPVQETPSAPTEPTGRERDSATSPREPQVSPGVAAGRQQASTQPTPDLAGIRNACAALRDAGKLPAVQALLKETGAKNLSSLKPEQLPAFAAGLRELGAKL